MHVATARVIVRVSSIVERRNVPVLVNLGIAFVLSARELVRLLFNGLGRGLAGRVQTLAGHLHHVDVLLGVVLHDDALERRVRTLERVAEDCTCGRKLSI